MKHNYFKSEQFGNHLRKEEKKKNGESLDMLLVKLKQAIGYYNHTNTFPKSIQEDSIDLTIQMLTNYKNKQFPQA